MKAAHKNESTLGRKAILVLGALSMVALVGGSVAEAGNHGRHREHRSHKAKAHVKQRNDHQRDRHVQSRHVRRHDDRRHDARRHDYRRRSDYHRGAEVYVTSRSRGFHVPSYIPAYRAHDYRRYSRNHVWHARHGHRHNVYLFPVSTAHGWIERPHYYCGGHLVVDSHGYRADVHGQVHYQGRNVGISIGF